MTYLDRHRRPLEPGLRVRVQYCSGPYGQTEIVTGRLLVIDRWSGLTIALDHPHAQWRSRLGMQNYAAGDSFYTVGPFTFDGGVGVGYHRKVDHEHGHETWVEILPEPA